MNPDILGETGCMVCGRECGRYTICPTCGVEVYLESGRLDEKSIMTYIKKHNNKRFNAFLAAHLEHKKKVKNA